MANPVKSSLTFKEKLALTIGLRGLAISKSVIFFLIKIVSGISFGRKIPCFYKSHVCF